MTLYDRPGTVGLTRIRQVGWDGAWNGMRCWTLHCFCLHHPLTNWPKRYIFAKPKALSPYWSPLPLSSELLAGVTVPHPGTPLYSHPPNFHHLLGYSLLESFNGPLYSRTVNVELIPIVGLLSKFPPYLVTWPQSQVHLKFSQSYFQAREEVWFHCLPPPSSIKSLVTSLYFDHSGSPVIYWEPDPW